MRHCIVCDRRLAPYNSEQWCGQGCRKKMLKLQRMFNALIDLREGDEPTREMARTTLRSLTEGRG